MLWQFERKFDLHIISLNCMKLATQLSSISLPNMASSNRTLQSYDVGNIKLSTASNFAYRGVRVKFLVASLVFAIDQDLSCITSKTGTPIQPSENELTKLDVQKIQNMYKGICN